MTSISFDEAQIMDASMGAARELCRSILKPADVTANSPFFSGKDVYMIHRGAVGSFVMPASTASCVITCSGRLSVRTGRPVVNLFPRDSANTVLAHFTSEMDEDLAKLFTSTDMIATTLKVSSSSGEDKNGDITGGILSEINQGFETLTSSRLRSYADDVTLTVSSEADGLTMTDIPLDGGMRPYKLHEYWDTTGVNTNRPVHSSNAELFKLQSNGAGNNGWVSATLPSDVQTLVFTAGNVPGLSSKPDDFPGPANEFFPNDIFNLGVNGVVTIQTTSGSIIGNVTFTLRANGPGGLFLETSQQKSIQSDFIASANDVKNELTFNMHLEAPFPIRGYSMFVTAGSTGPAPTLLSGSQYIEFSRPTSDIPNARTIVAISEGITAGDVIRVECHQLLAVKYSTRIAGTLKGRRTNTIVDESKIMSFRDELSRHVPECMKTSDHDVFLEMMYDSLRSEDTLRAFSFGNIKDLARKIKRSADTAMRVGKQATNIITKVSHEASKLGVPGASMVELASRATAKGLDKVSALERSLSNM